jgi:hypothetical protein
MNHIEYLLIYNTVYGNGGIAPLFLNLGECLVSHPGRFTLREGKPSTPLDERLCGSHSLSEYYEENCLPSVGNRTPVPLSFRPESSHSTDAALQLQQAKLYFLQSKC